jgi:tetratricopeptide (TPR) repeat protein
MNNDHIFISHATDDDEFAKDLRTTLEGLGLKVWVDSRNLRGGAKLNKEISKAITDARQVIVIISPNTVNSAWVRKEIQKALQVEKSAKKEDYRVIPLLLPGIKPSALKMWFDEEPMAVPIQLKPGGLMEAMPAILAGLGEKLPDDIKTMQVVKANPIEDLILELSDPKMQMSEGKRIVTATAVLAYEPANENTRRIESKRFTFTAPLGPIETEDLRWYLESYYIWPVGIFKERAENIEKQLPKWGNDLYKNAIGSPSTSDVLSAWKHVEKSERRFSVLVDSDLPEGTSKKKQAIANESASILLYLPWELLHDGDSYLFKGKYPVHVRRRLPNRRELSGVATELPIRILLVTPRPEDDNTSYIDHRISALPLVDAIESLGELVELTVLDLPTFPAFEQALINAEKPFHVVHFNGHGVYDQEHGLGGLCFEEPEDIHKLQDRRMKFIDANDIAVMMRDHRIPLVFLEACQTAKIEEDPTASVAASLLKEGVSSVVAMSHSVLIETTKRFVQAFYNKLAHGARVGSAMIAGQLDLIGNTYRGKIMGAGELHLQDWFVPVLYQEEQDLQLVTTVPPSEVQKLQKQQRQLSFGYLPEPPPHTFVGRSRELLALERLLHDKRYAVIRGRGGEGKTALAVELARWLVRTGRFKRSAFVSMETYTDVRGVVDCLGRQLLTDGDNWSVAQYSDMKKALQPIERALSDSPTIIVFDNLESILPDHTGNAPTGVAPASEQFSLCQKLLNADPATRIVFTSRESLTEPYDNRQMEIVLGALSREDAIELVSRVMANEGLTPKATDPGGAPQEITDLVEAVNRHARALVLLAREVSRQGVRATTDNLHRIMAQLHKKYPDDREQSLYASVELSLRRLSPEVREQIKPLAVFHGGVYLPVLSLMTGIETDAMDELAKELIGVGLAEDMGYGHLRLDPALSPYLQGGIPEAELEGMKARWADGMMQLTDFLYQQQFKDANLASGLTLLELPNLLMMLDWIQDRESPELVVELAQALELLFSRLGRPQALAYATDVRERATEKLGEWSNARFNAESANIDRLIEQGDLQSAYNSAQGLLKRCLDAGNAYQDADYDIAIAYFNLGRVLGMSGAAEAALQQLAEAQKRFQKLADAGNTSAEGMASVSITERADFLADLGRLDEAVNAYEDAIERDRKRNSIRNVAVGKSSLGDVRRRQERYNDAIEIYNEARNTFERLGEPGSVAIAWHQIGMVYLDAGQFELAEQAYRCALAINVQQKNRSGEALDLIELGNLYNAMGRLEEAVTFHRQSADIITGLEDMSHEGLVRSNIAIVLIKLKRYDEARRELVRAIECKEPYGHAAEPWKTWDILYDLEQATGNADSAKQAREKAIEAYLAYRRAGGVSQSPLGNIYVMATQAIKQGNASQLERELAQLSGTVDDPQDKKAISKLRAILSGDGDPSLANDPALHYGNAVELMLLLESL